MYNLHGKAKGGTCSPLLPLTNERPWIPVVGTLLSLIVFMFYLVVSFLGSGLSAACLYFITSSLESLVLSSMFAALSSVGISLMYCIAVELFPTEYRQVL